MKRMVDSFAQCSGLQVNTHKSQLFLCGVTSRVKEQLIAQLGFTVGMLPIKYLGLPLISTKLSVADCSPIIEKIKSRVNAWSAKMLTYAGRILLVKSVLFHCQVYWSNVFILPKCIIKKIDTICRNYIWSGKSDRKVMALVSWETICVPKKEGGLGVLQLAQWNNAACCKMLWKLVVNEDSMWTRWAKATYLKNQSLWNAKATDLHPWSWRKLLKLRLVFKSYLLHLIGDGRDTLLFYDNWLEGEPLTTIVGEQAKTWGDELRVAQWWSMEVGWCIPLSFQRRFPELTRTIQQQSISGGKDQVKWTLTSNQEFSVKSLYEKIRRRRHAMWWNRLIWAKTIPPKYSVICWLVMHQRLKTRCLLQKRGMHITTSCVLCLIQDEDCEHIVFRCSFSEQVWSIVLRKAGLRHHHTNWRDEALWLKRVTKGRSSRATTVKILFATTVYYLWQERNLRMFQNQARSIHGICNTILHFYNLLKQ